MPRAKTVAQHESRRQAEISDLKLDAVQHAQPDSLRAAEGDPLYGMAVRPPGLYPNPGRARYHIEQERTVVLTFLLAICLTYLTVLVGVALVLLLSWRRALRTAAPGKRHRRGTRAAVPAAEDIPNRPW